MMTDEEIIKIKKSVKITDYSKPWSETLAFARALLESAQNEKSDIMNSNGKESQNEKR